MEKVTNSEDTEAIEALESLRECAPMYGHFFDGLISGEFKPLPPETIAEIVDKTYFSFQPLISLDAPQEELLREHIKQELIPTLNENRALKGLCGKVYQQIAGKRSPPLGEPFLLLGDIKEYLRYYPDAQFRELSLADKIKLLNPDDWENSGYQEANYITTGFSLQGHRSLKQYGFSEEEWMQTEELVKATTGKDRLAILDVGCGIGQALRDIKRLDPSNEVHGLALDQEPVLYPLDQWHFLAAERMPQEFRGKFDIILSNVSFRYYLFPNIALQNIIHSLSKGGHAEIMFQYDRLPRGIPYDAYFQSVVPGAKDNYMAMHELLTRDFARYQELEAMGKLKLTLPESFIKRGYEGWIVIDKLEEISQEEISITN